MIQPTKEWNIMCIRLYIRCVFFLFLTLNALNCTLSADYQAKKNNVIDETPWEAKPSNPFFELGFPYRTFDLTKDRKLKDISVETYTNPPENLDKDKEESCLVSENENPSNKLNLQAKDPHQFISKLPPYRIKLGDQLSITIYGEPNTFRSVAVDSTGSISYLYVDQFKVVGKTIDDVRKHLEEKLKAFYKYPLVIITPELFSGNSFVLMGQVAEPGLKPLQGNPTLLSAIAIGGGIVTKEFHYQVVDAADFDRSFLARDGKYIPVDFAALIEEGDLNQDVPIKDGDYIYIAPADSQFVYILGEVLTPLTLSFWQSITLAEAISQAGGLTIKASSRIVVIRGALSCPVRYLVDINLILKGCACDFELEPGDIVYVPPRRFTTLREIAELGISAFIGTVSSQAGTTTYIHVNPKAAGTVSSPVSVINTSPTTFSPATPTVITVPGGTVSGGP